MTVKQAIKESICEVAQMRSTRWKVWGTIELLAESIILPLWFPILRHPFFFAVMACMWVFALLLWLAPKGNV